MHKFFICLFCLIISNFIQAEDWQGYWIKAVENCDKKDCESAKEMFDLAVHFMEENNDSDHPYVYVDRARFKSPTRR